MIRAFVSIFDVTTKTNSKESKLEAGNQEAEVTPSAIPLGEANLETLLDLLWVEYARVRTIPLADIVNESPMS